MSRSQELLLKFLSIAVLLAAAAAGQPVQAQEGQPPRVFLWDVKHLLATKKRIAAGDKTIVEALAKLEGEAAKSLLAGPFTLVNNTVLPPSGDKHDYMSLAPYWWPDPSKPDGLPYIRKDGETNPAINKYTDKKNMGSLQAATETLALAWYLTGKEEYADKAAKLLRVWFTDPDTLMNPNLRFAQAIPGINDGRGIGLIETRGLVRLVDAVGLLAGSKAWTQGDQQKLVLWFDQFLQWMLESPNGKDEAKAKNNHGTFYDVQTASFALFVGKTELAKQIVSGSRQKRIGVQVDKEGMQPLEMARTNSWGYSVMNLDGLVQLAILGEKVGVDLWNYQAEDGRGIRKVFECLTPFALGDKKWTGKQIGKFQPRALYSPARLAAMRYTDRKFADLIARIPPPQSGERVNLLFELARKPK